MIKSHLRITDFAENRLRKGGIGLSGVNISSL